jgi:hypothetical protein
VTTRLIPFEVMCPCIEKNLWRMVDCELCLNKRTTPIPMTELFASPLYGPPERCSKALMEWPR